MISRLAARQHRVVARYQLLAAGVTGRQIKRRLNSGRLVELHRGVYLAGAVAPAHAHEMAALLAYCLEATLSHRSAAAQPRKARGRAPAHGARAAGRAAADPLAGRARPSAAHE